MTPNALLDLVLNDLDDLKAVNILSLDVRHSTTITDYFVIATGNSARHVHALCHHLVQNMKGRHILPQGVEGEQDDEWVLVDLGDVVVHIMQPRIRDFYNLEKLWAPEITVAATA